MGIIEAIKMLQREEALEEGAKREATKFVQNLLATKQFSVTQIATLADVTEALVLAVQKGTNN